jgi:hypothetical protein
MPASYMAIMMESENIQWRPKFNSDLPDSGPDDRKLIIELEGDLEKVPWITSPSCGKATVDMKMLVASAPELFDKAWLRNRGSQEVTVAAMGNHSIIEIQL